MHMIFSLSSKANRIITMRKIRLEDFKLSWVNWWRWGCAYFCIYSCRRGMTGRAQRVTLWPRSWDSNHFHFRQRVWSIPVAKCEGCTRLPSRSRVDKREEPTESSVCTVRQSLRSLTCRIFMLMIQSSANSAALLELDRIRTNPMQTERPSLSRHPYGTGPISSVSLSGPL